VIRFLLRRLLLVLPTLFGVLVVSFLLLYVAPGDPVLAMVGERADSATITRLRRELKLDQPLPVQFGHYAGKLARGDLGNSYITRRPILKELLQRFPYTLRLALAAMLLATTLGILGGRGGGVAARHLVGSAHDAGRLSRRLLPGILGGSRAHPDLRRDAPLAAAVGGRGG
jgi:ABC-type dipeptide/oligopeptide/nickel transport system permease component